MAFYLGGGHPVGIQPSNKAVALGKRTPDVVADSKTYVAEQKIIRTRAEVESYPVPKQRRVPSGPLVPLAPVASRFVRPRTTPSLNMGYHNRRVTGSNVSNHQLDSMVSTKE